MGPCGSNDYRVGDRHLDLGGPTDRFHTAKFLRFDEWDSVKVNGEALRKVQRRTNQSLSDDRGNLESALTLIPLMVLFLTVSQLGISVYSRDSYSQTTQGAVAYDAMGASISPLNSSSANLGTLTWSAPPIALPLPGGGSVLVGQRQMHVPAVTPLLPGGEMFITTGVAVQE